MTREKLWSSAAGPNAADQTQPHPNPQARFLHCSSSTTNSSNGPHATTRNHSCGLSVSVEPECLRFSSPHWRPKACQAHRVSRVHPNYRYVVGISSYLLNLYRLGPHFACSLDDRPKDKFSRPKIFEPLVPFYVLPGPPRSANLRTMLGPISSYSAFV